ncbi:hypothetical protein EI94DRAFT_1791394 [Lactarius quietus]|nr:hypothetical protein EI94DRAFT_1791394 [Lactarius quietus]
MGVKNAVAREQLGEMRGSTPRGYGEGNGMVLFENYRQVFIQYGYILKGNKIKELYSKQSDMKRYSILGDDIGMKGFAPIRISGCQKLGTQMTTSFGQGTINLDLTVNKDFATPTEIESNSDHLARQITLLSTFDWSQKIRRSGGQHEPAKVPTQHGELVQLCDGANVNGYVT